jgi:Na+-driven multidrug efflux pump
MSVSTLVGAALGEGDIKKAKETFRLLFVFCSAIVTLICSATLLFSTEIV